MNATTTTYTSAYASTSAFTVYDTVGLLILSLVLLGVGVFLILTDRRWDIAKAVKKITRSKGPTTR